MQIEFRTKNDKQIAAAEAWIDQTTEQILYGGGKGGGKSYLGCSLIFADALMYAGTHYFIARKELNDLRKYTVPSIHEVFRNWSLDIEKYAPFNGQDNIFNLHNGSKVYLISCDDKPSDPLFERFGSMQMTRGWLEEAGEIPEAAKANLWLSIGRWMNDKYNLKKKLLITANPKKGWLKREFVDPFYLGVLEPVKKFIKALATDNKYLSTDYLNTLSSEKDLIRRQRLWEGSWDYDEDKDSLIISDSLSDAFTNTIVKSNGKYLTIDVARLGNDSTVFSYWDGLELYLVEKFQKQDTEETKKKVKDRASEHRIPYSHIMVDEDGIGGAVVDGLLGVKGFVANSAAIPTATEIRERVSRVKHSFVPKVNFKNLKSQCGWKLAELINEHKVSFAVPNYRGEIIEDLSAMLRDKAVDGDQKKMLRSKDSVKEEISRSPDVGDTILMRAWFELVDEALSTGSGVEYEKGVQLQQAQFSANRKNQVVNNSK